MCEHVELKYTIYSRYTNRRASESKWISLAGLADCSTVCFLIKLPLHIVIDIHNITPSRREAYKSLYEVMSPDDKQVPPFEKYFATRWLVRGKLIFRVLMNWNELLAYFTVTQAANTQNAHFDARMLLDMLEDPIVYYQYFYLSPLVTEFERVNSKLLRC